MHKNKIKIMKTKKHNRLIVALLIFTLISMYGFMPPWLQVNAVDSIHNASDTLSDSDLNAVAVHTFNFTTVSTTTIGGYWDIVFPEYFTGLATTSVTCAYDDASFNEVLFESTRTVRCTSTAEVAATTTQVIITDVTNPGTSTSYTINIYKYDSANTLEEQVQVMVYIIDDVLMTASVDATLSFTIDGLAAATVVNGVTCTETTTATTTPFGTLDTTSSSTVCQELTVATNATNGYSVTVEQNGELTSDGGANINSFNNSQNGTGTTTPGFWAPPTGTLDVYNTYGHMGLTSEDNSLDNAIWGETNPFNVGAQPEYVGFNGTDEVQVMYHGSPSNGTTENIGLTQVAYTAEISALQEAGDYESILTYICTPVY
jgi:hypothetical protein